ncbi:Rho GTPase-activating protein 25, partial [Haplosporangium sp. Z 767]
MLSPDRPSIHQTVNFIPPMLQQQDNVGVHGSSSGQQMTMAENVELQEWLQKRSTSLQLVWKRRWCVLRGDRLFYYRSNTDSKPVGVLHLAEYSLLSSGPELSRKSKLAFRLSSPEAIPHQHQHHLFFAETTQSLQKWLYALQAHIDHAAALPSSISSVTAGLAPHPRDWSNEHAGAGEGGEQSIIDKVLDRLHFEDPTPADMNDPASLALPLHHHFRLPIVAPGLISSNMPHNLPESHEDNNDTWSSTSSIPISSTNTSTNLDYIFMLNQENQQQQQQVKPSMDSAYEQQRQSPIGIQAGVSETQLDQAESYSSNTGAEQSSSNSDGNRTSQQSMDYQGRTSLQQPRVTASNHGFHVGSSSRPQSPRMFPLRSSVHSGLSHENGGTFPVTSAAGSPYASPTLTSQTHHSVLNATQGINAPQSPRPFYRVLENVSPGKRPESIASSTSISTIASSGDVSTINDLLSENGISVTATESSQNKTSHGPTLMGMVTANKNKKDKERHPQSSASSSHSGNGGG